MRRGGLNLRHLKMLQAVGRLQCVTDASRELNATQPAVTKAISNVEREIGALLFHRRQTGSYPTEAGNAYLKRVDRFFAIIETAIETACGAGGARRPRSRFIEQLATGTQMRALVTLAGASLGSEPQHPSAALASLCRSVRSLEEELGLPLLHQTPEGSRCSIAAQELARQFLLAMQELDYGRSEIRRVVGAEDAEITIGALPLAGSHELAKAVAAFTRERPTVRIRIVTGEYPTLLASLRHGRIDILFGILRKPDWIDDVVEEPCFQDYYCVVTRAEHPLTRKTQIVLADLATYDWIVPEQGAPLRGKIDEMFRDSPVRPHFGIETRSLTTIRALLFNTDLVTVLCRSEMMFDARIGVLKSIDCPFLGPISPKGIVTRANWLPTEAHLAFLECLRSTTAGADYAGVDAAASEVEPHASFAGIPGSGLPGLQSALGDAAK